VQWTVLLPYITTGAAWLVLPGLAIGLAARLRGWLLMSLLPVLSVFAIALSAVFAARFGIAWGPWPVLALTAVTVAITAVITWAIRRWGHSLIKPFARFLAPNSITDSATVDEAAQPITLRQHLRTITVAGLPLILAMALSTWQYVRFLGAPISISQRWDGMAHLSWVRQILNSGYASSFSNGGFYPKAWHDTVSLINISLHSSDVIHSTNAMIWIVTALVWPLGSIGLLRLLLPGRSVVTQLSMAILVSSFADFPSLLLGFGVLYPNMLGLSLLLPMLAVAGLTLGLIANPGHVPLTSLLVVTVVGLLGMALAHPNAVLSYIAFMVPMGMVWAWRGWQRYKRDCRRLALAYLVTLVVVIALFAAIWLLAHMSKQSKPILGTVRALSQVVTVSPIEGNPVWLLAALLVIGLVVAACNKTLRWWLGPFVIAVVLWYAAAALPIPRIRSLLVGGFYADPYRLAALLGIATLPITAFAVDWIWRFLYQLLTKSRHGSRIWLQSLVELYYVWLFFLASTLPTR